MTLSCIIPSLNRPKALDRTLRSLQKQYRFPDEIIIVLQADTPNLSKDLLEDSCLTIIRQSHPNAQQARNVAALKAKGDLLLFLDDDIEAAMDLTEVYFKAFQNPRLGAACGRILEPGETETYEIPGYISKPPMGWMRFPLNYGGDSSTRNFSSCNSCVRREIHLEAGGFDENFIVTIHDDTDWSLRLCKVLQKHGMEGRHLGNASLIHFREPSGGRRIKKPSRYVKTDAEGWASRFYFWRKNYGLTAWRECLRIVRLDLFCGSLFLHPTELFMAWGEIFRGWNLSSERLHKGPQAIQK